MDALVDFKESSYSTGVSEWLALFSVKVLGFRDAAGLVDAQAALIFEKPCETSLGKLNLKHLFCNEESELQACSAAKQVNYFCFRSRSMFICCF